MTEDFKEKKIKMSHEKNSPFNLESLRSQKYPKKVKRAVNSGPSGQPPQPMMSSWVDPVTLQPGGRILLYPTSRGRG